MAKVGRPKKKVGRPPKGKKPSPFVAGIDKENVSKDMKVSAKEIASAFDAPPMVPAVSMLSTGVALYDLVLGGGHGLGKIVNLVGDRSSGKTLLAMEFIAYCKYKIGKKFRWFYDDAEAGFSFNTQQLYGFEMIPEGQACSRTIEEFSVNFKRQMDSIRKGETLVYILDSLDSLTSIEELQREVDDTKKLEKAMDDDDDLDKVKLKGTFGMERQKKLSQFFRTKVQDLKDKQAILIVISQVRMNINVMFGEKYARVGGKALDFYAAQILWLSEVFKHKKKDRVVGITIKVRCKKNKLGKPFRDCFLDILFDYGVDDVSSNIKFLFDLDTPTGKEKETIKAKFDGKDFNSMRDLVSYIEKNSKQKMLSEMVKEKWNDIEDSISTKNRVAKWQED